jgi:PTH1 family peptidyl-tRNA hydrolase
VLDELARRAGVEFESSPVEAVMARWRVRDVLLAKPLTFMNLSGQAVGALMRYFRLEPADLLVIVDDTQLPLGRLRARVRGSAGGHNGLKSVIAHVGEDFARLRLGVGRGNGDSDLADYVLARFEPHEAGEVGRLITRAADATEMFISSGIEAVMNGYNGNDSAVSE